MRLTPQLESLSDEYSSPTCASVDKVAELRLMAGVRYPSRLLLPPVRCTSLTLAAVSVVDLASLRAEKTRLSMVEVVRQGSSIDYSRPIVSLLDQRISLYGLP